jgi:hypothetical protein
MTRLSTSQRAKLQALWRQLPAAKRAELLAVAEAGKDQDGATQQLFAILSDMEEGLRTPAGDLAKPYLLAPLRPMVAEKDSGPPSRFRFTPEDLSKIWGWLARHLAPDTVERAKKCTRPESDPVWFELRREAADALSKAVVLAERVPKDMTALMKRFGPEGKAMLADAVTLLGCSEEICGAMSQLPDRIEELDDDLCYRLKKLYEELVEAKPDAALWILLLTMGRLVYPWQIFRAVAKIGKRDDDLVVSKTDLAAVGDAILADTGYFAARLKQPPQTLEEAKACFALFDRFVAYSSGMTSEFGIRKAGRWGQVLFSLRAEASGNVEKILAKVPLALDSGLPEPRRGKTGRIIPAQLPSTQAIDRAEGLLHFLGRCREHANAAAIGSTQKRIADAAEKRMHDAGDMLVDLVAASEGQNRATAQEGLEITARLLVAAGHEDVASLLRRRGVAAAA